MLLQHLSTQQSRSLHGANPWVLHNNIILVQKRAVRRFTPAILIECLIVHHIIPYPRKRGPMGSARYIGPRLGGGPIFEVLVSQ